MLLLSERAPKVYIKIGLSAILTNGLGIPAKQVFILKPSPAAGTIASTFILMSSYLGKNHPACLGLQH
jgi:hypothetical protein